MAPIARAALSLAMVAGVGACTDPPTQVVVRVATDMAAGQHYDTLRITLVDQDGEVLRTEEVVGEGILADGAYHEVASFGARPLRGDATRRFEVRAGPVVDGALRFETRAITGFVRRRTIRLDLYVPLSCVRLAALCEPDETCGVVGCVDPEVPADGLPEHDDGAAPEVDPSGADHRRGGVELCAPWNGARVGSAHAPETLQPRIVWKNEYVDSYQVQIDDSCPVTGFEACTFPSPEIDKRTAGQEVPGGLAYRPGALPISTEPPVGRRYFVRVRACDGDACRRWSRVRYFDVGRLDADYDGDGYADAVVGAPTAEVSTRAYPGAREGVAFFHPGGAGGPTPGPAGPAAAQATTDGEFAFSIASAGDVDADGFDDLVIGWPNGAPESMPEGSALLLYGRAIWPADPGMDARFAFLAPGTGQAGIRFGASVSGAGDVDGDGFADFVVGAPAYDGAGPEAGRLFLYRGGPELVAVPRDTLAFPFAAIEDPDGGRFGAHAAAAGDVDGDGLADVVVGAPAAASAYVFRGTASGLPPEPWATLAAHDDFGARVSAGDLDGDGHPELVVAIPATGEVKWFAGGPGGPYHVGTFERPGTDLGAGLAVIDLDGDGLAEIAAGAPSSDRVVVLAGGPEGPSSSPTQTIDGPDSGASFGGALAFQDTNGDGWPDLLVGASTSSRPEPEEGAAFWYAGDGVSLSPVAGWQLEVDVPGARYGASLR